MKKNCSGEDLDAGAHLAIFMRISNHRNSGIYEHS